MLNETQECPASSCQLCSIMTICHHQFLNLTKSLGPWRKADEQLCLVLQNQLFWLFLLPICLKRFDGKIINHWSGPQRENDSRVRESITEWVSWTNTQTDFLIKWFIMNARGDQENLFINPLNCHKHRVTVAISVIYSIIFHSSDGQTMIQRQSHISTILHGLYRAW